MLLVLLTAIEAFCFSINTTGQGWKLSLTKYCFWETQYRTTSPNGCALRRHPAARSGYKSWSSPNPDGPGVCIWTHADWLLSARSTSALRPRLLYSRKTVGLGRARDTDDCVHTAHLARRTALAEFIGKMLSKHVLNDDSGSTLKASTVLGIRVQTHPTRGPASAITTPTPNPCSADRQVPPRPSCQGIYRPPGHSDLGSCVRALVQRRVSTQRHPVRQHWAAPLRRRSTDPGGSTHPLLQSRKRNQTR